jgi:glycerol-3-phosphate dehydrogenase (NAD(P)+)
MSNLANDTQKSRFLVIGAGSWGTALAILLSRQGREVCLWGNQPEHMQALQVDRENKQYLPDCPLPDTLQIVDDWQTCLPECEQVLIVVPSSAFQIVCQMLAVHLPADMPVCWATKGLQPNTQALLHVVAENELGKQRPLAVVSGPTFAAELAKGLPTAMTVASYNHDYAEYLASCLRDSHSRVYTSSDMIGVQVGGAAKNVIAIAAGIADGLGFGANTRAALITRGLHEIMRLGVALQGERETFMGLTGLGDLVLTCTDNQSRNRRFGYALSQGQGIDQARESIGQVVEGIAAATDVILLARRLKIEMPITEQVYSVVQGTHSPSQAVRNLLSREPKREGS